MTPIQATPTTLHVEENLPKATRQIYLATLGVGHQGNTDMGPWEQQAWGADDIGVNNSVLASPSLTAKCFVWRLRGKQPLDRVSINPGFRLLESITLFLPSRECI